MFKIEIVPLLQHAVEALSYEGRIFRVNPLQNHFHSRFCRWIVLEVSKRFRRPHHLAAGNSRAEAPRMADLLSALQVRLPALEFLSQRLQALLSLGQFRSSLRDFHL